MSLKYTYFILTAFLSSGYSFSQNTAEMQALLLDFASAKNDSLFIIKHSVSPYQVMQTDKSVPYDTSDALIKELYASQVGHVTGPYKKGNTVNYFKVTAFDSSFKARIGNILIEYGGDKRTDAEAHELARHILTEIKSGKDFNAFCHLYSDDHNPAHNCDIGFNWVNAMVYPVAKAVVVHKKGDAFVVKSQNGYHVIKMLNDPVLERRKVQFVKLALKL